jgi:hypothetical protein
MVQVTTEHLENAPGIPKFHEEEPFQIPGTQRFLDFSFKRLMYVTGEGGCAEEETSLKEVFLSMLSYFVNQDWRNKDDFLLVTVRFITVDFVQHVFPYFSCVKSVWNSFYVLLTQS